MSARWTTRHLGRPLDPLWRRGDPNHRGVEVRSRPDSFRAYSIFVTKDRAPLRVELVYGGWALPDVFYQSGGRAGELQVHVNRHRVRN